MGQSNKKYLLEQIALLQCITIINAEMKDAGYISQFFILPLWRIFSLKDINKALNGIEIFLVSVPMANYPRPYIAKNPNSDVTMSRAIWVCVKGLEEYRNELAKLGMTHKENKHYLDTDTGFLKMPDN